MGGPASFSASGCPVVSAFLAECIQCGGEVLPSAILTHEAINSGGLSHKKMYSLYYQKDLTLRQHQSSRNAEGKKASETSIIPQMEKMGSAHNSWCSHHFKFLNFVKRQQYLPGPRRNEIVSLERAPPKG